MSSPPSAQHRQAVKDHQSSASDAADRRRSAATELRKERRLEQVGKRRRTLDPPSLTRLDSSDPPPTDSPFPASDAELHTLLSHLRTLASSLPSTRLPSLTQLKTYLLHPSAPIPALLSAGVIPLLLHELTTPQWAAENQVEAVWALTNIAADSYPSACQVLPASPHLIALLQRSSHPELQEQSAWTLGNLAGDDQATRRTLIGQGVIPPLVRLYCQQHDAGRVSMLQIVAWALSNLVRAGEGWDVGLGVPFVGYALQDWLGSDQHVAVEVSWVLCHLSHHPPPVLQSLLDHGLLTALQRKLTQAAATPQDSGGETGAMEEASVAGQSVSLPSTSVPAATFIPLIRLVANVALLPQSPIVGLFDAAGPEVSIPAPGVPAVLGFLKGCLASTHRGVRKEAAWAVSSLAGQGHPLVVAAVLQAGLVAPLLALLHGGAFDQQKEAAFAVYHLALASRAALEEVMREGGRRTLACYLHLLTVGEVEGCDVALRMVRLVCEVGRREGQPWVQWVEEEDGIEAMERMMVHERPELWRMAQGVIDQFWGDEEGEEEAAGGNAQAPAVAQADAMSDIPPWRLEAMRKAQHQLSQQNGTH